MRSDALRVALVSAEGPFATGVTRYARRLTEELACVGVDVSPETLRRRELSIGGRRFGGLVSLWAQRLAASPPSADVVHALDPAAATRGTHVVTVHDLLPEEFPQWFLGDAAAQLDWSLSRRAARRARALVAPSRATARALADRWGIPPARIHTIHHGIDHDVFRPVDETSPHVPEGTPTFVTVCDDNPRKNILLAVDAVALLRARGTEARLVRVGPDRFPAVRAEYRARARAAGVELVEPGFLPDAALAALYSRCAAFLWPSLGEGFGFPPLEAMACGAPVVALDLPVNREVLGALPRYHANDAAAVADRLEEVLRAPPAPAASLAHARAFTWEESARAHAAVYESVHAQERRA